jgi:uncharacterized membrane protein
MNFPATRLDLPVALLLLALATALGVAAFASTYLIFSPDNFSFEQQQVNYRDHVSLFRIHVGFGIVALIIGPLQFFRKLRRIRKLHRALGSVYITSIAVSAIAGAEVATFAYGGLPNTVAFWLLSFLWLVTTLNAFISIKKGSIDSHIRWMIRSYAVTFAAVTLRAELGILIGVFGLSFDQAYAIVPWTCWALNLIVVEWIVIPRATALKETSKMLS